MYSKAFQRIGRCCDVAPGHCGIRNNDVRRCLMSSNLETGRWVRLGALLLAALIVVSVAASASAQPGPAETPKPVPPATVEAWKKAGAEIGWMKLGAKGKRGLFLRFPHFETETPPEALPSF